MKNKWHRHLLIAFQPESSDFCWMLAGLLAFLLVNAFPFIKEQWLQNVNKRILTMHEDYSCGDSYGIKFTVFPFNLARSYTVRKPKSVTNITKKH